MSDKKVIEFTDESLARFVAERTAALRAEVASLRATLQEARVLLVRYHTPPMCSNEQRNVCGTCLTLDEIDAIVGGTNG